MTCDLCGGEARERKVSYAIELEGKWIIVENVPATVCSQCGDRLFSANAVEKLQHVVRDQKAPCRVLETPVIDFSASE